MCYVYVWGYVVVRFERVCGCGIGKNCVVWIGEFGVVEWNYIWDWCLGDCGWGGDYFLVYVWYGSVGWNEFLFFLDESVLYGWELYVLYV